MDLLPIAITTVKIIALVFLTGLLPFVAQSSVVVETSAYFSVVLQMQDFRNGIIDSRALVFQVVTVWLLLFITVRTVEARPSLSSVKSCQAQSNPRAARRLLPPPYRKRKASRKEEVAVAYFSLLLFLAIRMLGIDVRLHKGYCLLILLGP